MRGEQENLSTPASLARAVMVRATFWRTEQSKRIGNLMRLVHRYGSRIVHRVDREPGFPKPTKIGHAWVREKRLLRLNQLRTHRAPISLSGPRPSVTTNTTGTSATERPARLAPAPRCSRAARMEAGCRPTMRNAPSAASPASSIMRGPAARRYTGVGVALRFLRRIEV